MARSIAIDARDGVAWSGGAQLAIAVLALLQVGVAARYLESFEFGQMAMVMVVVGFAQQLSDLGTARVLLHHRDATRRQIATLFWLSVLAGVVLGAALWAGAEPLAWLWGEDGLVGPLGAAAWLFVCSGASNVPTALLQRELRFRAVAAAETAGAACALGVVAAAASSGAGVYALVYGALTAGAVQAALALWLARDLVALEPRLALGEVRPMLSFGGYQVGERLVNFSSWNLDRVLIGAWLGAEALGLYHLAHQLMIRPFRLVAGLSSGVATAILSSLQSERERMLEAYYTSVRLAAIFALPLYMGMFAVSSELVSVLYGPRAAGVEPLFRILCPLGVLYAIGNPVGALVVATGRTQVSFLWNLWAALVHGAAVLVGLRFGIAGVAWAILLSTAGVLFPSGFAMRWILARVRPGRFLACLVSPLAYALAVAAIAWVPAALLGGWPAASQLLVAGALGAAVYLALLVTRERQLLELLWRPS